MKKETSQSRRKAIPKKVRFEVFKRDSFKCQYCGQSAPDVILHVDHIHPVSKGGDNNIMNLITSCQSCNSGKGAVLLSDQTAIQKQKEQLEELNEKRQQLEMMIEWRESLKNFDLEKAERVASYFEEQTGYEVNDHGIKEILKWLRKYSCLEVLDAIDASVRQYFKNDCAQDVEVTFNKIPRICSVKKREKETGESIGHLYYIRGILRNRLRYCNDRQAIQYLIQAHNDGYDEETLKEIALESKNWTQWRQAMEYILEEE